MSRLAEILENKLLPAGTAADGEETRIRDPIWGDINLQAHEMALLNTPLLQRLRRIKQLGGVHLAFPGATHTRFEHSLGVLEQASRMCDAIGEKEHKMHLRFAALCHDLGHGPFSHYSERFYPQMENGGGCEGAEQMSVLIVQSAAFGDFCARLGEKHGVEIDLDFVATVIAGGDLPKNQHYLGEIINGPFDADKIDYLTRDGYYCGMPVKIDAQHIHGSMTKEEDDEGRLRLAGAPRAAPGLIQLVHLRQHMFAVAYWHRIARICKVMFLNALRHAYQNNVKIDKEPLVESCDFLKLDDEMLLTPGVVEEGDAAGLFSRLRNRDLFKIALEINDDGETQQRIKSGGMELANEIADKAKVPRHLVALDPVDEIKHKEAGDMLIMQDSKRKKLAEVMKVEWDSKQLLKFLNRPLLCCSKEHKQAVSAAAMDMGFQPTEGFRKKLKS